MEASVTDDGLAAVLDHATGATNLLAGTKHGHAERRRIALGVGDDLHGCLGLPPPSMVGHGG